MFGYSNKIEYMLHESHLKCNKHPSSGGRARAMDYGLWTMGNGQWAMGIGLVVCKSLTYALTFCMQKGAAAAATSNALFGLPARPPPPINVELHVKSLMSACPESACQRQWMKRMRSRGQSRTGAVAGGRRRQEAVCRLLGY